MSCVGGWSVLGVCAEAVSVLRGLYSGDSIHTEGSVLEVCLHSAVCTGGEFFCTEGSVLGGQSILRACAVEDHLY